MKCLSTLCLLGIHLRSEFKLATARLGEPDLADHSPPEYGGDRFGTYTWRRHGLSILTWLRDPELVWAVRIDQACAIDSDLGFGVGSLREHVLALLPADWYDRDHAVEVARERNRLIVSFVEDKVSSVQLMAPMGVDS